MMRLSSIKGYRALLSCRQHQEQEQLQDCNTSGHPNKHLNKTSITLLNNFYIKNNMAPPKIKVAAIQAEPVWYNLEGTVDKSIALIEEAAANGANVVGFPEVFIPGYPW